MNSLLVLFAAVVPWSQVSPAPKPIRCYPQTVVVVRQPRPIYYGGYRPYITPTVPRGPSPHANSAYNPKPEEPLVIENPYFK